MAFLDNPAIILAHIRQSHVTSDDTGMCEMVLIDQDVDLEKCQLAFVPGSSCGSAGSGPLIDGTNSLGENHGCDLSQSMDITSSWDFGIRRRSNTGRQRPIVVSYGCGECSFSYLVGHPAFVCVWLWGGCGAREQEHALLLVFFFGLFISGLMYKIWATRLYGRKDNLFGVGECVATGLFAVAKKRTIIL